MRRVVLTLALVCLVVLSGCLGVTFGASDSPANAETVGTSSRVDAEVTVAGDSTAGMSGANPWGPALIVVAIDAPDPERDYASLVAEATSYWEENAERYAGYNVTYRVDPDADSPDVVINFVDDVPACGDTHDAVGCAPLITDAQQVNRPEDVYVQTDLSAESTTLIVKHELGHTLGLRHSDAPTDVMRAESVLYTQPKPNATERDFPWTDPDFTVYVDDANVSDPAETRDQLRHAFDYYESGAEGDDRVPQNLTFQFVDDPDEADVVVRFSETSPCGAGAGSCFQTLGPDPDGDGDIETYNKLRITLVDLDTPAVGWHVGNWLAYSLGMESVEERPAPFQDASYDDRRSDWWE